MRILRVVIAIVLVLGTVWLCFGITGISPAPNRSSGVPSSNPERCAPRQTLCAPPPGWNREGVAWSLRDTEGTEQTDADTRASSPPVPLRPSDVAIGIFTASSLHETRGRWVAETWGRDAPHLAFLSDAAMPPVDHNATDRIMVVECPPEWQSRCSSYSSHLFKGNLGEIALLDRFPSARYFNIVCDDHYIDMHNLLLHLEDFEKRMAPKLGRRPDPRKDPDRFPIDFL